VRCIAGDWSGRQVQLVRAGDVTRLQSTAAAHAPVVAEDSVALSALGEPLVLDRSVHIGFTNGTAAALPGLLLGGFLLGYPILAALCFLIALALFLKYCFGVRYVVELAAEDFRLVLEMERGEWLQLVLAARGYPARH
jgi:hypothetical protein